MKKQLFGSLLAVTVMTQATRADLIAAWNFNDLSTTSGVPSNNAQTSYAPSLGNGSLTLAGWTTRGGGTSPHGVSNFGGSTVNATGGDVAGQALALQTGAASSGTPNNGAFAIFQFNLLGYTDPILSFATQRTATGFNSDQLSYSTDGLSYTAFGAAFTPAASFATVSFDLSSINTLDDFATVFLRISFDGGSAAAGNNRLDNIQLNATPTPAPEPATWALGGMGVAMLIMIRRWRAA